MEKMIQALFTNEVDAFKGLQAIQQLEATHDIALGESYILSKDADGNTAIRSAKDDADGASAIGGGIIGGLIGLLAGPLGFLVGVGAGMIAGAAGDTVRAEGVSDYLDKVAANVPNGYSVLVAHIWEEWETPLDTVLLPLTNEVYRIGINDTVFEPAQAELEELDKAINNAESQYLGSTDAAVQSEWNEKLLLLKIKKEELLKKLNLNADHQEKQFGEWRDRFADEPHVTHVVEDKEKRDLLRAKIAEQHERLELLKHNR